MICRRSRMRASAASVILLAVLCCAINFAASSISEPSYTRKRRRTRRTETVSTKRQLSFNDEGIFELDEAPLTSTSSTMSSDTLDSLLLDLQKMEDEPPTQAIIRGMVYSDDNQNLRHDPPDELPAQGVLVKLFSCASGRRVGITRTNNSGLYEFIISSTNPNNEMPSYASGQRGCYYIQYNINNNIFPENAIFTTPRNGETNDIYVRLGQVIEGVNAGVFSETLAPTTEWTWNTFGPTTETLPPTPAPYVFILEASPSPGGIDDGDEGGEFVGSPASFEISSPAPVAFAPVNLPLPAVVDNVDVPNPTPTVPVPIILPLPVVSVPASEPDEDNDNEQEPDGDSTEQDVTDDVESNPVAEDEDIDEDEQNNSGNVPMEGGEDAGEEDESDEDEPDESDEDEPDVPESNPALDDEQNDVSNNGVVEEDEPNAGNQSEGDETETLEPDSTVDEDVTEETGEINDQDKNEQDTAKPGNSKPDEQEEQSKNEEVSKDSDILLLQSNVRIRLDNLASTMDEVAQTLFADVCTEFLGDQLQYATPPISNVDCVVIDQMLLEGRRRSNFRALQSGSSALLVDAQVTGEAGKTASVQEAEDAQLDQLLVGTFNVQGYLFAEALKEEEQTFYEDQEDAVLAPSYFQEVGEVRGVQLATAEEDVPQDGDVEEIDSNFSNKGVTAAIAVVGVVILTIILVLVGKSRKRRRQTTKNIKSKNGNASASGKGSATKSNMSRSRRPPTPSINTPRSPLPPPPPQSPPYSPTDLAITQTHSTCLSSPGSPVSYVSQNSAEEFEVGLDPIPPPMPTATSKTSSPKPQQSKSHRIRRDIMAPAGKLGIMVANTTGYGPAIHTIRPGSPMEGLVYVNDIIVAVNDVDTRRYTAEEITKVMKNTVKDERKITVLSVHQ